MTWLSFCIGYGVGFAFCLLLMIQVVKAKEVKETDDIDKSMFKEMEQLRAIREDKG
ncbi:hypothetical protein ORL93_26205 [Bacillus sp. DHT2]|uniref:hypothetical protein n=1 Tax=Bacillus sp. DHT2 TaxID=2994532 RepID=UPI002248CDCD|nr:hypothetical protein [Bacillus sp. DHT2]MCX2829166.1 hypothetical protein [Bacillus sp. DHT2]